MAATPYDAAYIASFYDAYGGREWTRFDDAPGGAANLLIHRDLLAEFVEPCSDVLKVGAGPGRFTIELARMGCRASRSPTSPAPGSASPARLVRPPVAV